MSKIGPRISLNVRCLDCHYLLAEKDGYGGWDLFCTEEGNVESFNIKMRVAAQKDGNPDPIWVERCYIDTNIDDGTPKWCRFYPRALEEKIKDYL